MFRDGAYGDWVRRMMSTVEQVTSAADRPDVVWAIHGSDSAHALARRLGAPWVADYKDNWDHGTTGVARAAAYTAHRRRTSSAASYSAASRLGAQHLRDVFGRSAVAVYTGVDVEAWQASPAADLGPRFNIVFTGHATAPAMRTDVVAQGLVTALRSLPTDLVAVHYYGHAGGWLGDRLRGAGLEGAFVDHGFEDRAVIARAQKAADLLLYLPYVRAPLICVKFFEYLASGRPVLSMPEERDPWGSADGLLVARTPDEVAERVTTLVRHWQAAGPAPTAACDLSEFEWRPQAERLLELLEGVARAEPPARKMSHSS